MKVLLVTPAFPFRQGSGSEIRTHQVYRELCAMAQVDVLSCHFQDVDARKVSQFGGGERYRGHIRIGRYYPFYLRNQRLHPKLADLLREGRYDFVVVRYYSTAFGLGLFGRPELILDCDDCGLELMVQYQERMRAGLFGWLTGAVSGLHALGYRHRYRSNLSRVRHVLFAKASSQLAWQDNFHLLPNRVSARDCVAPAAVPDGQPVKILFVGLLAYPPNFEGVDRFIERVWPTVARLRPDTVFKVAGGGLPPPLREKWAAVPGVQLCGFVPDIEEAYADAAFSISPVYAGSGTHIKVMESLLRARTMVLTPMAQRGYEQVLRHGESLLVGETDAQFGEQVLRLIDDVGLRRGLAARGREQVLRHFAVENTPPVITPLLAPDATGDDAMIPISEMVLPDDGAIPVEG
jgi:glycosyltransferase involved in cell wall biosynthesis